MYQFEYYCYDYKVGKLPIFYDPERIVGKWAYAGGHKHAFVWIIWALFAYITNHT